MLWNGCLVRPMERSVVYKPFTIDLYFMIRAIDIYILQLSVSASISHYDNNNNIKHWPLSTIRVLLSSHYEVHIRVNLLTNECIYNSMLLPYQMF
ncbi:hypothetical protein AQUCO_00300607v1 [Aquilegia coerulea]|uniref:Uncharacterized protein n=1 Tax=Aquilegia coerulea TaxID=218851 RepID=A0A2G5EZL0_AQUCA|nr:hypothetical protein AQUCO_00300607v1 [Aquilegia coerulea]